MSIFPALGHATATSMLSIHQPGGTIQTWSALASAS